MYCLCGRELETTRGLKLHAKKCPRGLDTLTALEKGGEEWKKLQDRLAEPTPPRQKARVEPRTEGDILAQALDEVELMEHNVDEEVASETESQGTTPPIQVQAPRGNIVGPRQAVNVPVQGPTGTTQGQGPTVTPQGQGTMMGVATAAQMVRVAELAADPEGLARTKALTLLAKMYGSLERPRVPPPVIQFVQGQHMGMEEEERRMMTDAWDKLSPEVKRHFLAVMGQPKDEDGAITRIGPNHSTFEVFRITECLSQALIKGEIQAAQRQGNTLSLMDTERSERIITLSKYFGPAKNTEAKHGNTEAKHGGRGGRKTPYFNGECHQCHQWGHKAVNCRGPKPKGGKHGHGRPGPKSEAKTEGKTDVKAEVK